MCNFPLISLIFYFLFSFIIIFFSAKFQEAAKCFAEMPLLFLLGSIRGSLIDSLRYDLNTVCFGYPLTRTPPTPAPPPADWSTRPLNASTQSATEITQICALSLISHTIKRCSINQRLRSRRHCFPSSCASCSPCFSHCPLPSAVHS